jgi:hypothetical protein
VIRFLCPGPSFSPFWCPDAKGGEDLFISTLFIAFIGFGL